MSAIPNNLNEQPVESLQEQDIVAIREWERFKWLAGGLTEVVERYNVARLAELLETPPTMPGQREKVIVLLALKATPQALSVLEDLDTSTYDAGFRELHKVALRYARSKEK